MNRTSVVLLAATLIAAVATSPVTTPPVVAAAPLGAALQAPSADPMLEAWRALTDGLDEAELQATSFAFDDVRRHEWFYTPVDRVGLRIGDLDDGEMERLRALLRSGLGDAGTEQAFDIVDLEEVLYVTSGGREMRNPGNYYLMTFGTPALQGAWGWRFEGHHLATSFTIVDGNVVAGTPAFFGGNPARVPDDSEVHAGLAPFAREQELGFRLLHAFDDAQRARAIIADEAPRDILTGNAPSAEMGPPEGISIGEMSESQHGMLHELVELYGGRMSPALFDYQMAKIREAGAERVHFAWAGATQPGQGHYYRIQGPTFVIEYDNTQGNANHVHSVWRDFDDDLGEDPLRQHLAADHGLGGAGGLKTTAHLGNGDPIGDDEAAHRRAHARGTPHHHPHR